jgi:hypothetical protein
MSLFRTTPAGHGDLDPRRLEVAAHELGHLIAYQHAGLAVRAIRITGRGEDARGAVRLDPRGARTAEQARGYLVGLLAGRVAALRWCHEHGPQFREHVARTDRALYREFRRHPWVREVPDAHFQAAAHDLIHAHWSHITRQASRLAREGRLPL